MIHLDTNYLIGLLVKGSQEAGDVDGWLSAGQTLAAILGQLFQNCGDRNPSALDDRLATAHARIDLNALAHV